MMVLSRYSRSICIPVLLILAALTSTPAAALLNLEEQVVEYVLPNGLTFLLLERDYPPIFSTNITYKAGSVEEVPGITGIAHLLEHMAFKGTENIGTRNYKKERKVLRRIDELARALDREMDRSEVPDSLRLTELEQELAEAREDLAGFIIKDEIGKLYGENGAVGLNASTGVDVTRYYVSLPSNRIELWMYIESDRMRHPVFREFYTERDVVMEERRLRTLTEPSGLLYETFLATAYLAHPYGQPTVGWMSDLRHLTVEDAERFFHDYYTPSNCVVSIVGDINIEKTKKLIDDYFGPIRKRKRVSPPETTEPPQNGERRAEVVFDAQPVLLIGFPKPVLPDHDDYVFDLLDMILSSGRTSRLYRTLVESGMAVSASTSTDPGNRYPNLFVISATPRSPHTTRDLEDAIYAELDRLRSDPVSDRELKRAVKKIETSFVRSLASHSGLANRLAYYQTIAGDFRYMTRYIEEVKTITAEDIMDVAQRYLVKDNRTVATLVKGEDSR